MSDIADEAEPMARPDHLESRLVWVKSGEMITVLPTRPDGQRELIACPSTTRLGYGAHDDSGNSTDYHAGQVRYVVLREARKHKN